MKTPILFLIFNRPILTQKTFEQIKNIKPEKLFIAADGPRKNNLEDFKKCKETRDIVKNIDWSCELKILFREENLGCKLAVSSAIDWFFKNVEEGIILEDDCLPNKSFFMFCERCLKKYRNENKIMHISGSYLDIKNKDIKESYFFSKIPYIWGWATWKRSWEKYSLDIPKKIEASFFENKKIDQYWKGLFYHVNKNNIDTWDSQWTYTIMKNAGLCITPTKNMINNMGFGEDATHTKKQNILQREVEEFVEISEMKEISYEEKMDIYITKKYYIVPFYKKILWKIKI